ncbi:MAG TPA: MarP family serine protease [Candidatus Saccharimonadales bacterium]|jgi:S1-C subfamily serine protease
MSSSLVVDLIIFVLVVVSIARGWEIGWLRQFFSTIGFFGGLFLGAAIQPSVVNLAHTTLSRTILTLALTLGLAFCLLTVGEFVGFKLKTKIHIKQLNTVDSFLGSGISLITILFSVWLCAAIISSLALPSLQVAVDNSAIIRFMDRHLPAAPSVISEIGSLIDPNGFPQVFVGGEPAPKSNYSLPTSSAMQAAVNEDAASVVKIEGAGCGGIVEGSGFIVSPGIVATNAHVVAGIAHPYIYDANGTHSATVIWFNPNLDFAVLKTTNLAGKPLTVDSGMVSSGTGGAVLGYPGGGSFTASTAAVLNEFNAVGRNIYGTGETTRSVYELKANVIPGNSGGPFILQNGEVSGVVFAESTTYSEVGYALTSNQIISAINQAKAQDSVHSTGSCAE